MKRAASGVAAVKRSKRARGPKRRAPRSRKAAQITGLVEALSAGFAVGDGAFLGRNIAGLIADAYKEQGRRVPPWVRQLIAYYARGRAAS